MEKIKLTPLQQSSLEQIQKQKAELTKVFQDWNEKEKVVLEFVFEDKIPVGSTVGNIRLENDYIIYELVSTEAVVVEEAPAPKAKMKKLK